METITSLITLAAIALCYGIICCLLTFRLVKIQSECEEIKKELKDLKNETKENTEKDLIKGE